MIKHSAENKKNLRLQSRIGRPINSYTKKTKSRSRRKAVTYIKKTKSRSRKQSSKYSRKNKPLRLNKRNNDGAFTVNK